MIKAVFKLVPFALMALVGSASAQNVSEQEAYAIAKDAYVYAYPLTLTHATVQRLSNFAQPVEGDAYGPPNQFHHVRPLPTPKQSLSSAPMWTHCTRLAFST
ncbi:hypothetical protein QIH80_11010 [Bradyrhizobium elkanii]|nr:hypothetical protein QIH80_11010 [Bradyrhizobium elkanii]